MFFKMFIQFLQIQNYWSVVGSLLAGLLLMRPSYLSRSLIA
jgi:hypothetical protein